MLSWSAVKCEGKALTVAMLLYPQLCDREFARNHSAISAQLVDSAPAALIHDLSQIQSVHLGLSDQRRILTDARGIASRLERVAFVYDAMPVTSSFLNSLLWLSPVQPARAFADLDSALKWSCGGDLSGE